MQPRMGGCPSAAARDPGDLQADIRLRMSPPPKEFTVRRGKWRHIRNYQVRPPAGGSRGKEKRREDAQGGRPAPPVRAGRSRLRAVRDGGMHRYGGRRDCRGPAPAAQSPRPPAQVMPLGAPARARLCRAVLARIEGMPGGAIAVLRATSLHVPSRSGAPPAAGRRPWRGRRPASWQGRLLTPDVCRCGRPTANGCTRHCQRSCKAGWPRRTPVRKTGGGRRQQPRPATTQGCEGRGAARRGGTDGTPRRTGCTVRRAACSEQGNAGRVGGAGCACVA